ncbi:hypothetical protein PTSG_00691 [Salpingoeca rosetta]|uniref:PH domain-containing protein n=1 Tax=Salpingoeca rosetta (strain ATCC 50818 / BSB-021) TaxID=946362 RepID=F2TX74_SALR5|nr:uncharacterized protein PTSG_00691 [Salpingoeca rosetta]EGD75983.1 hypothetical protein PTSG_00691 [Salpingoeca rosetta]|eukprot:XP_004998158.1 hypothetical protein PTSG_00691 [Salpingoeca rosetta]
MSDRAKPGNLQSPYETCGWLTLKEGYLQKTKLAKGLIPSTKLRWFALKQNPKTYESRLEYYEGRTCKGWISLRDAVVMPTRKLGAFTVTTYHKHGAATVARTMKLQGETHDQHSSTGWVVALKNAAKSYKEHGKDSRAPSDAGSVQRQQQQQQHHQQQHAQAEDEAQAAKLTPELLDRLENDESSVAQRANRTGGEELDGDAIDRARWQALQRRFQHSSEDQQPEVDLEEDEDVRLLREMEEEEERRQEEERLAFLAERQARLQRQESVRGLQDTVLEDDGAMSEGDEWDPEEEMRLMREAEEEEERRQEEERRLWLEEQRKKKEAEAS